MSSFDNEMAEILESFRVESNEIMERLGQDLLSLEKEPSNSELHNTIFRAVHTVKGTSSFLGFDQMTELAHHFEDVLNKIRKGELRVTSDFMDVMFEGYDLLKELLRRIESKNSETIDLTSILAKLDVIAGQTQAAGTPAEAPSAPPQSTTAAPSPAVASQEASKTAEPEEKQARQTYGGQAAPQESKQAQDLNRPGTGKEAKSADTTIRVDVTRLDSLMNLVGELVLGRNRMAQVAAQINADYEGTSIARDLAETSSQIDFITTELQMAVMKTRMIAVAKVFNKLPRLVRDLSKETNKEIDLHIVGEETELDKTIIEELNDPLIHIIRNACDHGVETPEERTAAGKSPRGTVIVKAEHEGNHIVISIQDDGKGMDPEKLKRKGIERGLITEAEAQEMSDSEAFNLIFAPGFSMAAKITNVSGRGVGMDVVRTNISKLKGIIEIESGIGKGSKFIIKLPLTLAIIQGLLVEARKEVFSVPLESVLEVVRVQRSDIETINGKEVIRLRNTVLPLARIANVFGASRNGKPRNVPPSRIPLNGRNLPLLGIPPTSGILEGGTKSGTTLRGKHEEGLYIVVIGLANQRMGIIVDSLLGQKEVVIKSLGGYLGNIDGIAGSTILGDGRVIMIVDVGQFMRLCAKAA